MNEKQQFEKEPTPKSFIRINGVEHNLKALFDLLKEHGIKVNNIAAQDIKPGAQKRITKDFIPSLWTEIEIEAPYDEARRVLESSNEFREHANKILGSI